MDAVPGSTGRGTGISSLRQDPSVKGADVAPGTLPRILAYVRPYSKLVAILLLLITVNAAIGVADPLIYRSVINDGILGGDAALVIRLAALVAVLAVVDASGLLLQRYLSLRIGEGIVFDLRTRVFSHVQRMGLPFFVRSQTGALVSRLDNDVQGARDSLTNVLSAVVGNLVRVTMILVAMFALSWRLTAAALVLLPFFAFTARWLGQRIRLITREGYDLNAQMNSAMVERFNVAGAMLVKLFGRPETEDREFALKAGRVRDIAITRGVYGRVLYTSLTLTAALAGALVYGWGGVMAVHKTMDVGTVVALAAYLGRLYGPLTALSNVQVDVMTTLVSFERVFEVLDLPVTVAEKPGAVSIPRGSATIEFDSVSFAYPAFDVATLAAPSADAEAGDAAGRLALDDISFTAEPGQLVALVGPSGAGKTTITSLIPRLYDVTSGVVRLNGIDVRDATLASIRELVSMVTQDPHLFHDTIRANLLYARPEATEDELRSALAGAQILPLVDSLPEGLDTVVGERGYRLSGGEKQRVAIARLLLRAPDVVVLDEATAHLDSESEHAVQQALKTALAGRTSIVIAHRLSTILHADQILVVDRGAIVERGTHVDLLAAGGPYAELYRTQFQP